MDLSQIVHGPLPNNETSHRRSYRDRQLGSRGNASASRNPRQRSSSTSMTREHKSSSPRDLLSHSNRSSSQSRACTHGAAPNEVLLRHDQRNETMGHESAPESQGDKRRKCPICKKSFYSSTHVEIHENTVHKGIKSHKCHLCPARFGQSGTLTRHLRTVHEKRRDHECREPFCGKRFSSAWSLKVHVQNVHEKLRPYVCRAPGCRRNFGNLWNRRKHERNVHGIPDLSDNSTQPH